VHGGSVGRAVGVAGWRDTVAPGRGCGYPGGARRWGRREEKRSRRLAAGRGTVGLGAGGWEEAGKKPNLIPYWNVNPNPRVGLGSVLIDQIIGPGPLQETGI
jgi:hypothetical protein